jgi:hypothetical protein
MTRHDTKLTYVLSPQPMDNARDLVAMDGTPIIGIMYRHDEVVPIHGVLMSRATNLHAEIVIDPANASPLEQKPMLFGPRKEKLFVDRAGRYWPESKVRIQFPRTNAKAALG